jgi:capsular exopolysaccharide synthesis family protein
MDNYLDQFEQDIQEKPIDWREIFETLLMNWKWFVFSAVVALLAGSLYVRMQKDVYELKSSILIIDQSRSGQMNEMSVLRQLDAVGVGGGRSYSMVNNEEQVLISTVLLRKVVERLELYTSYSQKDFLKTTDLYVGSPLYVRLDSVSLAGLKSPLSMWIKPSGKGISLKGDFAGNEFELSATSLPAVLNTPAGVIYIQRRDKNIAFDHDLTVTIQNPVKVARSLSRGVITTEVGKMIDVINLTVKINNVKKGQDILNTLAEVYNRDASEQNSLSAVNTALFIDGRLKLLASELSDVEKDVENYKQQNKLTDIKEDVNQYVEKNGIYDRQQIELEMQKNLISYVEEFVKSPSNQYALIPNLGITDPGLTAAIQQYNTLLMTRERVAGGSTEDNPSLKAINQQIMSSRRAIQNGISTSRKGLQITGADLQAQNNLMQQKIRELPRQEREFIEIKRQQQVKESLYLFLLQKREEAALNMAVSVPKGRVLDTPDDAVKVAPKSQLIILVFLFAGLVIPALIIYLLELINTSIRYRSDVEKLTDVPVITELAHNTTPDIFIDYKSNSSSNSELFRLLRTKLQFALEHPVEKVILVTSTMPGEGKTFASINLAITLSLAEKKVLLMGMDLRRPQLSKHFGLHNTEGITSYLAGQVADIHKLISSSENYPSLDILPAGYIPPNPTELIMKDRFNLMVEALKKEYDYIVIDTAPVGAVSDTLLIDRVADITLYITRADVTDKRNVELINRLHNEKSLKRIYIVVNDVDVDAQRYSYKRKYGYGYGYGYVYGYGSNKK